jgi:hypothetical protein
MLFPMHLPTIVLPDFIRSCSAAPKQKKSGGLTEKRAGRMAGMTV